MAIVSGGLGLPEEGALVVAGLGATTTDTNAIAATLAGSSTLSASLTDGSTPTPPPATGGGGVWYPPSRLPKRERPRITAIPVDISAKLAGRGSLAADLTYEIDTGALLAEMASALLLELI